MSGYKYHDEDYSNGSDKTEPEVKKKSKRKMDKYFVFHHPLGNSNDLTQISGSFDRYKDAKKYLKKKLGTIHGEFVIMATIKEEV